MDSMRQTALPSSCRPRARTPPINIPVPVRYYRPQKGGVSHFHYWRDNALLTWMHFRLLCGFLLRLPLLAARRLRRSGTRRSAN